MLAGLHSHLEKNLLLSFPRLLAELISFPSSVPGSGRSAGEGIGYPLQYCWASLVAQLVKNLPAMQVRPWFIPWVGKIPLEKGKATHFSILAWRIPWTGHKESDMTE